MRATTVREYMTMPLGVIPKMGQDESLSKKARFRMKIE
jgi:hypothetical protein